MARLCLCRFSVPQSALPVVAGVDDGPVQHEEGLHHGQGQDILPGIPTFSFPIEPTLMAQNCDDAMGKS